jgi:L-ascorbate metabolism protein UlaG (beta-lactamase superfamily)
MQEPGLAMGWGTSTRIVSFGAACCLVVLAASGCAWSGGRAEVSPGGPEHHLVDGTFRNPPGSPQRDHSFGTMAAFLWGRMTDSEVHTPGPEIMMASAEARQGVDAASNPSVTWLGHAGFLIRLGGKTVLTDPFLGNNAGPGAFGPERLVPPPIAVEDLPPVDVLILSHNHYDHLDLDTVEKLAGKDSMTVLVPLGLKPFFTDLGYVHVIELDWWQSHETGPLEVQALPAVHFSGRGLFDRNRTLWASFAIRSGTLTLWFSGDTAPGAVFEEIGRRAGPFDLAMVGIGAYEPRAIMKASHATPEEAIDIVRAVGAPKAIGMHWGTVKMTPEDPFEAAPRFKAAAKAAGYGEDNAWILKIGETRELGALGGLASAAE